MSLGKRSWNSNFHGGLGKRRWNSNFSGGLGKRAWNSNFSGGLGKRAWNKNFSGIPAFLSALLSKAFFVQGDLANGHGTVTFPEDLESVLGTAGFLVIH